MANTANEVNVHRKLRKLGKLRRSDRFMEKKQITLEIRTFRFNLQVSE